MYIVLTLPRMYRLSRLGHCASRIEMLYCFDTMPHYVEGLVSESSAANHSTPLEPAPYEHHVFTYRRQVTSRQSIHPFSAVYARTRRQTGHMSKRSLETSSDRAREANRRRLWTTEEDSLLIEAVQGYSDGAELNSAWPLISNIVGNGRSSKVSRARV